MSVKKEVRELFIHSRLNECLSKGKEILLDNTEFQTYQICQMYTILSHYELGQFEEGEQSYSRLINQIRQKKVDIIDSEDLLLGALYSQQLFDVDKYLAKESNENLLKMCKIYKDSHSDQEINIDGIYHLAQGMYLFIENNKDTEDIECITLLKKALELNQEYDQEIEFLIGWMLDYKDFHKQSLEYQLNLYNKNKRYPGIANNIAVAYQQIEQKEKFLLEAYELCPTNPVYNNNLALYYSDIMNVEKSKEYFKKSLECNPKRSKTYYLYGQTLIRFGEIEEGEQILNKGIEINPNEVEIYITQASRLMNGQINQQCVELIQKCINFRPKDPQYFYYMGLYYLRINQFETSLQYNEKALSLKYSKHQYMKINSHNAICLFRLGKVKDSLELLVKLLNETNYKLADIYFQIKYILEKDKSVPLECKLSIINSNKPVFLSKLEQLIPLIQDKKIKISIEQVLSNFLQTLKIIAYNKHIQSHLTFQNLVSHWDLYID